MVVPRLYFCAALFSLAFCSISHGVSPQPEVPIARIAEIKMLPKEEAAEGLPVRVQGVVIECEDYGFVIHDGSEGLFVLKDHGGAPPVGRKVVVEGTTGSGEFAPLIHAQRITVLGDGSVVPRAIKDFETLETGALDCQWIEVDGLLRSAQPPSPAVSFFSAYAILSSGPERLNLAFTGVAFAEVKKWVGARVRIRAACLHYFNPHGQLFGARLILPGVTEVQILHEALPHEAVPLTRIDSLLRYSPQVPAEGRVHIQGEVTYQQGETELYVQQDHRGVYVHHSDQRQFEVGDVVDVVGFVRRGIFSPEIEDAEVLRIGHQGDLPARPVTFDEAAVADGELVALDGVLLDYFIGSKNTVLTVKAGGAPFTAELPLNSSVRSLPAVGSLLHLTGITRVLHAPPVGTPFPWRPSSFCLYLRTPDDLSVLKGPEVSLTIRLFGAALAFTAPALLIAGALWWRSRATLRAQRRQQLARETEFATMIKERMRLAREIHDSLAQGFTAVSIQLEIAKHKLPSEAAIARAHIEVACTLVRDSLAEARSSIQGLRSETLSNADFMAALQRTSTRILKDTDIVFHPELFGNLARLGAEGENELLRIATEAMTNTVKHARAKNIRVTCRVQDEYGELHISDDGVGLESCANQISGYGLRGMRERAHRLHGHLVVTSDPSHGTQIIVRVPIDKT